MGYLQLLKAQAASLAGTAVDFLVTIGCVRLLLLPALAGTVLGNVAGGIVNFYLGRHHVFGASRQSAGNQAVRYGLVWLGSLLLNSAGFYLFTEGLELNYLYSKIIVSLLVGIGFNYFMQLHFVFRKP